MSIQLWPDEIHSFIDYFQIYSNYLVKKEENVTVAIIKNKT